MTRKRTILRGVVFGCLGVFAAIQFVPADLTNPPTESEIETTSEVKKILTRACYDCHSNETHWPWYSHIAPASWLIEHDVKEGRAELNFSTWNRYSEEKRAEKLHEMCEEVEEREMPLWFYVTLHSDARLTADDIKTLRRWADAAGGPASRTRGRDDHEYRDDDEDDDQ